MSLLGELICKNLLSLIYHGIRAYSKTLTQLSSPARSLQICSRRATLPWLKLCRPLLFSLADLCSCRPRASSPSPNVSRQPLLMSALLDLSCHAFLTKEHASSDPRLPSMPPTQIVASFRLLCFRIDQVSLVLPHSFIALLSPDQIARYSDRTPSRSL